MLGALWAVVRRVYEARWTVLPPLTGVAMLAMLVGAVVVAPREAIEGEVQRIFYIHVPSAIAAYLAYFVVFGASILVLWRSDLRFDAVARAAATVGVLFTALTLATGAIWGKPIWGTWWAWDARLTSTLVLLLIYSGYLLARSLSDATDVRAARYAAVFAIIGGVDIPIINMSVRWWRTLHPDPIVTRGLGDQALPTSMLLVLLIGLAAVTLLALWLLALRAETERIGVEAAELRAHVDRIEAGSAGRAPGAAGDGRDVVDYLEFLFAGFAVFWAGLFVYLLWLQARLRTVQRELETLKERLAEREAEERARSDAPPAT